MISYNDCHDKKENIADSKMIKKRCFQNFSVV